MHTYERTKDNMFRVYFDSGYSLSEGETYNPPIIKDVRSEIEAAILVSFLNGGGGPSDSVAEILKNGKNGKW